MRSAAVPPPRPVSGAAGQSLFGDRVADAVSARASQLVLGLDPDPSRLWPRAAELADAADTPSAGPSECAARAVAAHCALVLEATAEQCVAVKLQVACFERLGAAGWTALERVTADARGRGLLVIADAKRGDIDITAAAYAQAFFGQTPTPFGPVASLGADALTANPLLGADSLAPLVARARENAAGVFVLVHTSNPGAADVQELELSTGGQVSEKLAQLTAELGSHGVGAAGLSDVGAVVGATAPDWIGSLRERMPHAIFLLPGVGAQGGAVEDLGAAFAPGPAGGLVTVSRAVVSAHERRGGEPAAAARSEAERLRGLAWELGA
jgi:orotidine-5'-phosphate decarboxylase